MPDKPHARRGRLGKLPRVAIVPSPRKSSGSSSSRIWKQAQQRAKVNILYRKILHSFFRRPSPYRPASSERPRNACYYEISCFRLGLFTESLVGARTQMRMRARFQGAPHRSAHYRYFRVIHKFAMPIAPAQDRTFSVFAAASMSDLLPS